MSPAKQTSLAAAAFAVCLITGCVSTHKNSASTGADRPMLAVLDQFEQAPATGPGEAVLPPPTNGVASGSPKASTWNPFDEWPGKGLAQHPFLFYGEGRNVLYVVNHGRVVWSYTLPRGGEIDDAWMMSNGHIICTKMNACYEITPQKEIVWFYQCPTNTQIHALQPIGLDKVMVVENGLPPHLYIINKADGAKIVSHELPTFTNSIHSIHTQFRNCRVTAKGTYLLGNLDQGSVDEYDKDWNLIWTYDAGRPWSEVRLKNGNTLIPGDNRSFVHEVNPQGHIVWAVESNSIPGIRLHDVQTADRLANGNTIICNRGGSAKGSTPPQIIEVTPQKRVVWVLQDYTDLPSCTGVQLLDEPGIPENPGDLMR